MLKKIRLYLVTARYLKIKQIIYLIVYNLKFYTYYNSKSIELQKINYKLNTLFILNDRQYLKISNGQKIYNRFNLETKFKKYLDWNFIGNGRLWNYHLRYFEFLNQKNLSTTEKITVISNFNNFLTKNEIKLEPYPTSKRLINVISFLISLKQNSFQNNLIQPLFKQYCFLKKNIEYNILGNHLFENLCSLYISSLFFSDFDYNKKIGRRILIELDEQICDDGSHFELSPMYHKLILFRLFQLYKISQSEKFKNKIISYIQIMVNWLNTIAYNDGSVPHFNDSTNEISMNSLDLFSIANNFNIIPQKIKLGSSGYRKYTNKFFEFIIDVNGISPEYQPGHSHSDHLSFEMRFNNIPYIVDPGISTYEICERRTWERSTMAHNTISINNSNQSRIWKSFRVADRAKVTINKDLRSRVNASCVYNVNGYKVTHEREVVFKNKKIKINDQVTSLKTNNIARYYLHPDVKPEKICSNKIKLNNELIIEFENSLNVLLLNYLFNRGFNDKVSSKFIKVELNDKLSTSINII